MRSDPPIGCAAHTQSSGVEPLRMQSRCSAAMRYTSPVVVNAGFAITRGRPRGFVSRRSVHSVDVSAGSARRPASFSLEGQQRFVHHRGQFNCRLSRRGRAEPLPLSSLALADRSPHIPPLPPLPLFHSRPVTSSSQPDSALTAATPHLRHSIAGVSRRCAYGDEGKVRNEQQRLRR